MYPSHKKMNEKVHISYNAAKRVLLELLENNDFSKDQDIIKRIHATVQPPDNFPTATIELSKIVIDKQCRISLPDYGSEEVRMPYLPKTVFFFFLFHPEGVEFKSLYNYTQELYAIYQVVSSEKNTEADKMKCCIKNLVEPSNNRIYEACSIIRKALSRLVPKELLEVYCIVGKQQNRRHLVMVNRDLICIENEQLRMIQSKY